MAQARTALMNKHTPSESHMAQARTAPMNKHKPSESHIGTHGTSKDGTDEQT